MTPAGTRPGDKAATSSKARPRRSAGPVGASSRYTPPVRTAAKESPPWLPGADARAVRPRWHRHHGAVPRVAGQQQADARRSGLPPRRAVHGDQVALVAGTDRPRSRVHSRPGRRRTDARITRLWFVRRFVPILWTTARHSMIGATRIMSSRQCFGGGGSSSGAAVKRSSTPQTSHRKRMFTLRISPGGGGGGRGRVSERSMRDAGLPDHVADQQPGGDPDDGPEARHATILPTVSPARPTLGADGCPAGRVGGQGAGGRGHGASSSSARRWSWAAVGRRCGAAARPTMSGSPSRPAPAGRRRRSGRGPGRRCRRRWGGPGRSR